MQGPPDEVRINIGDQKVAGMRGEDETEHSKSPQLHGITSAHE